MATMDPMNPNNYDLFRTAIMWPAMEMPEIGHQTQVYLVRLIVNQYGVFAPESTMPFGILTGDYILGADSTRTRTLAELAAVFLRDDRTAPSIWLLIGRRRLLPLALPRGIHVIRIDPAVTENFGAQFYLIDGNITASSVVIDGAAGLAGLRNGDQIIRLGIIPLESFDPISQFNHLRGMVGALPYDLTVVRPSEISVSASIGPIPGPLPWSNKPAAPKTFGGSVRDDGESSEEEESSDVEEESSEVEEESSEVEEESSEVEEESSVEECE